MTTSRMQMISAKIDGVECIITQNQMNNPENSTEMENSNSIQYRKGIDLSNLDRSYDPSDNFYKFACGGWQKNNPLPAYFASYGTFSKLDDKAKNQVKSLIEGLSSHPEAKIKGTNAQKVNDLFRLGMDVDRLNKLFVAPL
ncbi:MAG: hypothetical protein K2G69_03290, partial [Muribaculaceae bacterium]|nr:hypothetical protein [Muribaculaceae bacterium]